MNIVWMLLLVSAVLTGISVVVYGPKTLIDVAWARRGKWLVAAEIVNVICIFIAGVAIVATLIVGLEKIFEPYLYYLLVAAGAVAFTVYFYIVKDEARRKAALTPKLANEIINQYGAALERGLGGGNSAIPESSLPCSKERIKQAVKVTLAFKIKHDSLREDDRSHLVAGLMYLYCFVPDDQAHRVNDGPRTLRDAEYSQFTDRIDSLEIKTEMDLFVTQVQELDSIDPLFLQKVYTLVGLEYFPAVKAAWNEDYWDAQS